MTTTIQSSVFKQELLVVLEEAFTTVQGFFLDAHTSLFETLADISAEEASIPVGGRCATLAAQVEHIIFFLESTEDYMRTNESKRLDWGEVWRRVGAVTPEEWDALRSRLNETYQRMHSLIETYEAWDTPGSVAGAVALVAHVAYHLGEIRQATCTLKG